MTRGYWVSSKKGTYFVEVDENGKIVNTSNLWRRFTNQRFEALTKWLGDAKIEQVGGRR